MLKIVLLFILSSLTFKAFAEEATIQTTMPNRFHLLNMKCEAGESDRLDTSPQSPPLDVDDPGTPGCNRWEINLLVSGDITKTEKSLQLPLTDINYGVGDNWQIKYEVPFVTTSSDEATNSGMSDSILGLKYQFYENEETETQLGVYPQVTFITPGSEAAQKGLTQTGNIVTLPLLLATKLGETSKGSINLTANLGYNFSSKTDVTDYVSAALGIGLPVARRVAVMGEVSTEQGTRNSVDGIRNQLVKMNLGAMGIVNKQILLYSSIGQSLYSSDDQIHSYLLAGIRILTK
jgi:hypothetical protein